MLLVTHHGSDDGSRQDFLATVKPEWAVVSVGKAHGHPSLDSMVRVHKQGATIWCTAINGTVTLRIAPGGELAWEAQAERQQAAWWLKSEKTSRGTCVDKVGG